MTDHVGDVVRNVEKTKAKVSTLDSSFRVSSVLRHFRDWFPTIADVAYRLVVLLNTQ